MKNLDYEGYTGSIEYSAEDDLLYGKVLGIRGLISYEGKSGKDLEDDFKVAINSYLASCQEASIPAEKPFKGSFNVRIPAALHREAALDAMEAKVSLNNYVAEAIRSRVAKEKVNS